MYNESTILNKPGLGLLIVDILFPLFLLGWELDPTNTQRNYDNVIYIK